MDVIPQDLAIMEIPLEKRLFAHLFSNNLAGDSDALVKRMEFLSAFPDSTVFKNEYFVLYNALKRSQGFTPDAEFLTTYMANNQSEIRVSKNIDLAAYSFGENDTFVEFSNAVLTTLSDIHTTPIIPGEFGKLVEETKMSYVTNRSLDILQAGTSILVDGVRQGNKVLSGFTDMNTYVTQGLTTLSKLTESSSRKGIISYRDVDEAFLVDNRYDPICQYGIDALDAALTAIYGGEMISILAPTKGGKSRFVTHVLHNAVIQGANVVMWSQENGFKGWESLIRARHFEWFYNSDIQDVAQKKILNNEMILKGWLTPELADLEQISWTDLRNNLNYGIIKNIDEDLTSESLIPTLHAATQKMGTRVLVCVDYLQLLPEIRGMSQVSVIAEAYKSMLQFLKSKKIAGIFPGQIKQTKSEELGNIKEEDMADLDLRTVAGGSHEVLRTPDINMLLYATPRDLAEGSLKLYSAASRNSKAFAPIQLYSDLGTSSFYSV